MAFFVNPEVFHVANTQVDYEGVDSFLVGFGCEDWRTDTETGAEELVEIAGRRCYNSFESETHKASEFNPNISKVREGNASYIGNILKSGHGAVIEHVYDTYLLHNVSRTMTHELVRHRLANYSQESLRYVRLTDIGMWFPGCFEKHEKAEELRAVFLKAMTQMEDNYKTLEGLLGINDLKSFTQKKKYTSAMRRIMPIGLATGITVTMNARMWRHTIAMRTSHHAEEEIRLVFGIIAKDLKERYPNLFQDMQGAVVDGYMEYTFGHFE
jgi:thymidylate synthase (FAD)